jgi:hypothetical protein
LQVGLSLSSNPNLHHIRQPRMEHMGVHVYVEEAVRSTFFNGQNIPVWDAIRMVTWHFT